LSFFHAAPATAITPLSLHDALPISDQRAAVERLFEQIVTAEGQRVLGWRDVPTDDRLLGATAVAVEPVFRQIFIGRGPALAGRRSEEHTSELQSRGHLVCRLLLEKK